MPILLAPEFSLPDLDPVSLDCAKVCAVAQTFFLTDPDPYSLTKCEFITCVPVCTALTLCLPQGMLPCCVPASCPAPSCIVVYSQTNGRWTTLWNIRSVIHIVGMTLLRKHSAESYAWLGCRGFSLSNGMTICQTLALAVGLKKQTGRGEDSSEGLYQ